MLTNSLRRATSGLSTPAESRRQGTALPHNGHAGGGSKGRLIHARPTSRFMLPLGVGEAS
jgi:hypothetical protein